jgi:hypothetical protein
LVAERGLPVCPFLRSLKPFLKATLIHSMHVCTSYLACSKKLDPSM